jgi:hypothetical protein
MLLYLKRKLKRRAIVDDWGVVIGLLGALSALATVIVLFLKSRGENKTAASNSKNALDARIDARVSSQLESAWTRIDAMEGLVHDLEKRESRRTNAITRILRDIAKQWPDTDGPKLNPIDIAEIEETIPSAWIKKNPSGTN